MISEEIWKDIKGYEGQYEVSNLGRVKSCERYITHVRKSSGATWVTKVPERLLSLKCDSSGYPSVMLYEGKKISKRIMVHLLVAQAFIPNPYNLPQINHKDENKSNNRVDNLEWCTRKYNMNYGTLPERISKANAGRKHTDDELRRISECSKRQWKIRKENGWKMSDTTKEKIRQAAIKQWERQKNEI